MWAIHGISLWRDVRILTAASEQRLSRTHAVIGFSRPRSHGAQDNYNALAEVSRACSSIWVLRVLRGNWQM